MPQSPHAAARGSLPRLCGHRGGADGLGRARRRRGQPRRRHCASPCLRGWACQVHTSARSASDWLAARASADTGTGANHSRKACRSLTADEYPPTHSAPIGDLALPRRPSIPPSPPRTRLRRTHSAARLLAKRISPKSALNKAGKSALDLTADEELKEALSSGDAAATSASMPGSGAAGTPSGAKEDPEEVLRRCGSEVSQSLRCLARQGGSAGTGAGAGDCDGAGAAAGGDAGGRGYMCKRTLLEGPLYVLRRQRAPTTSRRHST